MKRDCIGGVRQRLNNFIICILRIHHSSPLLLRQVFLIKQLVYTRLPFQEAVFFVKVHPEASGVNTTTIAVFRVHEPTAGVACLQNGKA